MIALVLASLTALSLGLLLWQWFEAVRFPLHRRQRVPAQLPPVTLLKPLKGADAETENCLRSWLAQDYPAPVQTLFAVASEDDPAAAIVKRLLAAFPLADARLVVCPQRLGPNSKVSKLAQLEPLTKHELLVVSDADVWVPPDWLGQMAATFAGSGAGEPAETKCEAAASGGSGAGDPPAVRASGDPPEAEGGVVLVCPFYQLATPATPAMRWEALAVNADFWSSVLQARRLTPMRFALGAVMAVRREALAGMGGFASLVNHLADDYELGRRVSNMGARIELCPATVECREAARGWRAVWGHQLRWARTIRHCQPGAYAASILSNPALWPLLWLAWAPGVVSAGGLVACLICRLAMAAHCQRRLTRAWNHARWLWLAPVKDLLGAVLWALSFLGRTVEWRGERYRVRRGGELASLGQSLSR